MANYHGYFLKTMSTLKQLLIFLLGLFCQSLGNGVVKNALQSWPIKRAIFALTLFCMQVIIKSWCTLFLLNVDFLSFHSGPHEHARARNSVSLMSYLPFSYRSFFWWDERMGMGVVKELSSVKLWTRRIQWHCTWLNIIIYDYPFKQA